MTIEEIDAELAACEDMAVAKVEWYEAVLRELRAALVREADWFGDSLRSDTPCRACHHYMRRIAELEQAAAMIAAQGSVEP